MNNSLNKYMIMLSVIPILGLSADRYPILNILNLMLLFYYGINGYLFLIKDTKYIQRGYNGWFIFLLFLYVFIIFCSCLINQNLSVGVVYTNIFYVGLYLYYYKCFDNFREFILYFTRGLMIFLCINLILCIIKEHSSYIYSSQRLAFRGLFGNRNTIPLITIPTMLLITIKSDYIQEKFNIFDLLQLFVCYYLIIMSKSSTGLVIGTIALGYIFFKKYLIRVSFLWKMLVYLTLFFSLVIFKIHETILSNFITMILKKNISLTGRTFIWDYSLQSLVKSPFIGFGSKQNLIMNNFGVTEAHNGFIEILMATGLTGLMIILLILWLVRKKLDQCHFILANIIGTSIFIYLLNVLTESGLTFHKFGFWLFVIMSINIEKIKKTVY